MFLATALQLEHLSRLLCAFFVSCAGRKASCSPTRYIHTKGHNYRRAFFRMHCVIFSKCGGVLSQFEKHPREKFEKLKWLWCKSGANNAFQVRLEESLCNMWKPFLMQNFPGNFRGKKPITKSITKFPPQFLLEFSQKSHIYFP